VQDICNRYKLLRGFRIHYVPGWDCHGMPIEVKALEQLRASSSPSSSSSSSSSSATSVSASAASASADGATLSAGEVRSLASRFALAAMQEQKSAFMRWGLLGAWDTPYATMDPRYESAQLGVFATLVRKGLVYRGLKPVYWSPVSRTALAEAELEYVTRTTCWREGVGYLEARADFLSFFCFFFICRVSACAQLLCCLFYVRLLLYLDALLTSYDVSWSVVVVALQYVDNHVSTSLYVGFPVTSLGAAASNVSAESPTPAALSLDRFPGLRALLWTTTPWTLPANQAIAFHPELEYAVVRVGAVDTVLVKAAEAEEKEAKAKETKGQPKPKDATPEEGAGIEGAYLLVCTARLETLRSLLRRDIVVESTFPGSALEGAVAAHPFLSGRVSPFIPGSHVASDAGTGLVHTAPAHGAEDFAACRAAGINEVHCPVSANGDYDAALVGHPQLVGHNVLKGASKTVVAILRANGGLVHTSRLVHRFPYDWRSKTPVIQRATEQWFCRLDALAPQAQRALQQQVRLVPEQGAQRLHSMIASRKEWCISRQRHWGVPIPVFYPNDGGEPLLTPESVAHVAALVRQHGTDCWWSLPIEDLLPPSHRAQAAKYTRGSDTMDVWFDSGCSWRAVVQDDVLGFKAPAEQATAAVADGNVEPVVADMYLEGSDQHRGWFQSSLLTAVAAMDRAPYKTILTRQSPPTLMSSVDHEDELD
jgi:isoleucyl-tRNA synthetase